MIITLPVLLDEVIGIDLPYTIFEDDFFEFKLTEFQISEKKELYGLSSLELFPKESKTKYKPDSNKSQSLLERFSEFLHSNYKIEATVKQAVAEEIQFIGPYSYNLSLCTILYFEYPILVTIYGQTNGSTYLNSGLTFNRPSAKKSLDKNRLDSFKKTLKICMDNNPVLSKKKSMFYSLLNICALRHFNLGLNCSTYVTILESLFTQQSAEIGYKFKMRMSKYLGKDFGFAKYINELYNKRSAYYHTGEQKFVIDDAVFLSAITRQIVIEYLSNPTTFDLDKLDEQLLM